MVADPLDDPATVAAAEERRDAGDLEAGKAAGIDSSKWFQVYIHIQAEAVI
jgi:hypothetical protein